MHKAVMQFIVDLFEADINAEYEFCLDPSCCKVFKLLDAGTGLYTRTGIMAPKKKAAIAQALQKTGCSIKEIRSLLRVKPANHRNGCTDEQLLAGQWYPGGCVTLQDLVKTLNKRFPDPSS